MIFHPLVMALSTGSLLVAFMILYASVYAVQILRRWDIRSGSEFQLRLERRTYLVSTFVAYAFVFEILSFFLYVFTADQMHDYFVGAMCAAGSLYANVFGYPTLIVKIINFVLAGIWLALNYVDRQGYDYPLIKIKCAFLLVLLPLILFETYLQANYFIGIKPNIITSCCGTLFSSDTFALPSMLWLFSPLHAKTLFYGTVMITIATGCVYVLKNKGGYMLAAASLLSLPVVIIALFSFISSYIYELPTHRCPFCILQKEYKYIGYFIYMASFGGSVAGITVGVLMPFRNITSLASVLPHFQRNLALISSTLFLLLTVIVTVQIYHSALVMEGWQ